MRIFDLLLSLTLLVVFAPVLVVIFVLVRLKLGSPVIFRQTRPGIDGKSFVMFKFRTMRDEIDSCGNQLSDYKRLDSFGKLLRSTSLDELPELWNVLRGDMSLVGPRPLLMEYMPLYSAEQLRRHEVKPGITGWAQINGRNSISWEEKLKMDVWYVDNKSFWLNIKILLLTLVRVVNRDGISKSGYATTEKFTGGK